MGYMRFAALTFKDVVAACTPPIAYKVGVLLLDTKFSVLLGSLLYFSHWFLLRHIVCNFILKCLDGKLVFKNLAGIARLFERVVHNIGIEVGVIREILENVPINYLSIAFGEHTLNGVMYAGVLMIIHRNSVRHLLAPFIKAQIKFFG
jgi:hypothetical protein